jgi:glycosyltransferase involved in cell wall biosynthesis
MGLMDYVEFLPHTHNPFQIVANAYFVVLTSRYEGFPMVLVEALSLGTPVVSVNCETGPIEIISNEENMSVDDFITQYRAMFQYSRTNFMEFTAVFYQVN